MAISHLIKILVLSLIGLVVTFMVGLFLSTVIAVHIDLNTGSVVDKPSGPTKPYYTREEMDRADREYEEKVKRFDAQLKKYPPPARKFLLQARSVGIPYSWIPWIFIPWIGRTKKPIDAIPLLSFPIVGALAGVIFPIELAFCFLACLLGIVGFREFSRLNP